MDWGLPAVGTIRQSAKEILRERLLIPLSPSSQGRKHVVAENGDLKTEKVKRN